MRAVNTIRKALAEIFQELDLPLPEKLVIESPREASFGDLSTNAALLLSKKAGKPPRELAKELVQKLLSRCPELEKAEIAGPGFCNLTFRPTFWQGIIGEIESRGEKFGESNFGENSRVLVEYVSANPTGPLHVGHGRGAAVGDTLARLLRKVGYSVGTEYYLNDAGRQMQTLGLSVWLRARELSGEKIVFPEDCYQGSYIADIACAILKNKPDLLALAPEEAQDFCYRYAMNEILEGIKADLSEFRVGHETFFSEKSLVESGAVAAAFAALAESGYTYELDGALWFASTRLGDDKDRVLRKSDGSLTYFASDIAYHLDKFKRGYQWLIDVWGADHHGYIARMRAALTAMENAPEALLRFDVVLIQLVNLLREGKQVGMSTRAGEFVTLAEVVREVGADAARFSFLMRKSDSPLDFDLELAKERSLDNPVYYVQYAHARVCSLLRRAEAQGIELPAQSASRLLELLIRPEDLAILRQLAFFEESLLIAAQNLAPHHLSRYLYDLAGLLHSYYAKYQILVPDDPTGSKARLVMLRAVAQVLRNGLSVLGVSAPDSM